MCQASLSLFKSSSCQAAPFFRGLSPTLDLDVVFSGQVKGIHEGTFEDEVLAMRHYEHGHVFFIVCSVFFRLINASDDSTPSVSIAKETLTNSDPRITLEIGHEVAQGKSTRSKRAVSRAAHEMPSGTKAQARRFHLFRYAIKCNSSTCSASFPSSYSQGDVFSAILTMFHILTSVAVYLAPFHVVDDVVACRVRWLDLSEDGIAICILYASLKRVHRSDDQAGLKALMFEKHTLRSLGRRL